MRARECIRTAVFAGFFALGAVHAGDELALTEDDYGRLTGQWVGTHHVGMARQITASESETPIELVLHEDNRAEFLRPDKNRRWESDALVVDGKLELGYAKKKRLFTVSENDGKLEMVLEFKSTKGAESRDVTVILVKQ